MLIKEACQACGLTKKALEYYEKQGLLQPRQLANGYRDYGAAEIARLKEIAVLRKCGLSMAEVGDVIHSAHKQATLARIHYLHDLQKQKQQLQQECLALLMSSYDLAGCGQRLQQQERACFTICERLVLAFPGNYGVYIALHFGRFLDIMVETPQQEAALAQIMAYLDQVSLPEELSEYLTGVFAEISPEKMAVIQTGIATTLDQSPADWETFMERNKIQDYLSYRLSPAFSASPAGRLLALLQDFQKSSGYREIFLENLQVLSPAYREHCARLAQVDAQLLAQYPQTRELYGNLDS